VIRTTISTIFFGSSDYCIPILESLFKNTKLVGIVTKPDLSVGHSKTLQPTPVKKYGQSQSIPVYTPDSKASLLSLKDLLTSLKSDIAVVADYGFIIPKEIFLIPAHKTLNIHFSKLPKLRGSSPVQYTILLGEKAAWITIILMDETMDTGDILWQKEVPLTGKEETDTLYRKLFEIASEELPNILNQYADKSLLPVKQDNSQATYTKRLTRQDGFIPWEIIEELMAGRSTSQAHLVRWPLSNIIPTSTLILNPRFYLLKSLKAFSPWPGVWTEIPITQSTNQQINKSTNKPSTKRLKVLNAHIEKERLVLDEVQLEGKKPVSWKQFCQGYPQFS
jgi:methionyl-tRNA formyltransferase